MEDVFTAAINGIYIQTNGLWTPHDKCCSNIHQAQEGIRDKGKKGEKKVENKSHLFLIKIKTGSYRMCHMMSFRLTFVFGLKPILIVRNSQTIQIFGLDAHPEVL